jgi:hypothetical protein
MMNGKIAAILLALVSACTIVEVLDVAEVETPTPMMQVQKDTTDKADTIRIPIGFEVVVEEWEENDTTL